MKTKIVYIFMTAVITLSVLIGRNTISESTNSVIKVEKTATGTLVTYSDGTGYYIEEEKQ